MKREGEQVLCRFYLTSLVRHRDEPLYQWIVEEARREGMGGATVLKGFWGLRQDGHILHERTWALSQEVPTIVEVVDEAARIERLLAVVEPALVEGVVTLERAHVVMYRGSSEPRSAAGPLADILASQHQSVAREVKTMVLPDEGVLLRIFIGEADTDPATGRPLYEAIVMRAREVPLAGATVLKGPLGFGRNSHIHAAKLLELSTDLPVVIEIVDAEEKVKQFLPVVDELVTEGLVTLEAVRVLKYASSAKAR